MNCVSSSDPCNLHHYDTFAKPVTTFPQQVLNSYNTFHLYDSKNTRSLKVMCYLTRFAKMHDTLWRIVSPCFSGVKHSVEILEATVVVVAVIVGIDICSVQRHYHALIGDRFFSRPSDIELRFNNRQGKRARSKHRLKGQPAHLQHAPRPDAVPFRVKGGTSLRSSSSREIPASALKTSNRTDNQSTAGSTLSHCHTIG